MEGGNPFDAIFLATGSSCFLSDPATVPSCASLCPDASEIFKQLESYSKTSIWRDTKSVERYAKREEICWKCLESLGLCTPEQHVAAECSLEEQSNVYKMGGGDPLYSHIPGYRLFMLPLGPCRSALMCPSKANSLEFLVAQMLQASSSNWRATERQAYEEICRVWKDMKSGERPVGNFWHRSAACGSWV